MAQTTRYVATTSYQAKTDHDLLQRRRLQRRQPRNGRDGVCEGRANGGVWPGLFVFNWLHSSRVGDFVLAPAALDAEAQGLTSSSEGARRDSRAGAGWPQQYPEQRPKQQGSAKTMDDHHLKELRSEAVSIWPQSSLRPLIRGPGGEVQRPAGPHFQGESWYLRQTITPESLRERAQ